MNFTGATPSAAAGATPGMGGQVKLQGGSGLQNVSQNPQLHQQTMTNSGSNNMGSGSNNFGQGGATLDNPSLSQQISFNP